MSRKKIGLFVVGAIIVAAAAVAGGTDEGIAAVIVPTPTLTASASESPSVAPTASPLRTRPPRWPRPRRPLPGPWSRSSTATPSASSCRPASKPSGSSASTRPRSSIRAEPEACYGAEATAFAKDTLDGQAVTLELDPTQDERDRYDRLLAHVHVGDTLYAAEAIAAGYGIHYIYERPSIHADELDAAAETARDANAGIWASCDGRVDLPVVPVVEPAPVEEPDPEPPANADCHPSYEPCVPNAGHDLDCGDIGFAVAVIGPDEYRLDGSDNDGRGCESY